MSVVLQEASVEELKQEGHKVTTASNWTFGEIASRLVAEHNWTDQQVADEFGKSQQSVNYARRIFERFYQRAGKHVFVWRDWMKVVAWSDADKCLDWAEEQEATFAEMAAWRRAQNGEDIKTPPKPTAASNLTADDLPEAAKKESAKPEVVRPPTTTQHTAATRKPKEPEKPRTQPVQSQPGQTAQSNKSVVATALKVVADLERIIDDENERKKAATKLRSVANKLDPPSKFQPPSVDEVADYCKERGNGIDAEAFVAWGKTNGWKLSNGNPMKDWRSSIITWEKRDKKDGKTSARVRGMDWSEYE